MSAAWRAALDGAQHRVQRDDGLALPTSPISSRCIGRGRRDVARRCGSNARRWSPVGANGSDVEPRVDQLAGPGAAPARAPARLGRACAPASASSSRKSSSNASRCRASSGSSGSVREVHRGECRRALGEPLRRAQARRAAARPRRAMRSYASQVRLRSRSGRDALARRIDGDEPERVDCLPHPAPISSCSLTQNWLRFLSLPCSRSAVPSDELAREPRLVEPHRDHRPGLVRDARLDALLAPVAHRLHADAAHGHRDRRLLAHAERRDACGPRAGRGGCAAGARAGRRRSRCRGPAAAFAPRAAPLRPRAARAAGWAAAASAAAAASSCAAASSAAGEARGSVGWLSLARRGCKRRMRTRRPRCVAADARSAYSAHEEPPPRGLAALVVVELDCPPGTARSTASRRSGAPSPAMQVTSSQPSVTARSVCAARRPDRPRRRGPHPSSRRRRPHAKRPAGSSRAARATPPVRTASATSRSRSAFSARGRRGVEGEQRRERLPAASASAPRKPASRTARPRARRPGSRSGCSAARRPSCRARRGCPRGCRRSTGSSSGRRRRRARPARGTSARAPRPWPRQPASHAGRRAARSRSATCSCMSATSKCDTSPCRDEHRRGEVGLVGVHVDLQRRRVADDEHAVADLLEQRDELARVEPLAGDGEVRAVAVLARLVLGQVHRARRSASGARARAGRRRAAPAITPATIAVSP